nr:MAG TPA: hypothetical protein [Caudoviricetes sp.]
MYINVQTIRRCQSDKKSVIYYIYRSKSRIVFLLLLIECRC